MSLTFSLVDPQSLVDATYNISDNLLFKDAVAFSHFVEVTANREDRTCTDIILEYCDVRDLEADDITKLISPSLKGKLENEMIEMGLISEGSRLAGM